MQKIITDFVSGPFKNEAEFKKAFLAKMRQKHKNITFFEIENEEKSPGMPDIIATSYEAPSVWTEIKYAGKDGKIKFQPSQPLWYKQNKTLRIQIVVWDSRRGQCIYLPKEDVIKAKALVIPVDDSELEEAQWGGQ